MKMTDLRKAAEDLMPILERWKMTYPPCSGADWEKVEALRQALAQPEQEPVAWVDITDEGKWSVRFAVPALSLPDGTKFYTAPPKREWVGLTRRELDIATLGLEDLSDCYKAIEAKLKEKNT